MNCSNSPIGVFDSGVGGLTVVKEIFRLLPHESIIYFGDTARVPYGTKSKPVVEKFSLQIARFLVEKRVKLVLIACNTASSYALTTLKKAVKIPVINVIEPGAKEAIRITSSRQVGVIGTEATIKSQSYVKIINKLNKRIKVYSQACPLFVPLVEEDYFYANPQTVRNIAKQYLLPLKKFSIDTLILGCTHYSLLKGIIQKIMGRKVKLIDSGKATAKEVKRILEKNNLTATSKHPKHIFYASDSPEKFSHSGQIFLGKSIAKVKKIKLEN